MMMIYPVPMTHRTYWAQAREELMMPLNAEDLQQLHDRLFTELVQAAARYQAFASAAMKDTDPTAYADFLEALEAGRAETMANIYVLGEPRVQLCFVVDGDPKPFWQSGGREKGAGRLMN